MLRGRSCLGKALLPPIPGGVRVAEVEELVLVLEPSRQNTLVCPLPEVLGGKVESDLAMPVE